MKDWQAYKYIITIEYKSISTRVIYGALKLNARYNVKVMQIYAHTLTSREEEIDVFYDNLNEAIGMLPAYYALLICDFNGKIGRRQDKSETLLAKYGYGERNKNKDRPLNFLQYMTEGTVNLRLLLNCYVTHAMSTDFVSDFLFWESVLLSEVCQSEFI